MTATHLEIRDRFVEAQAKLDQLARLVDECDLLAPGPGPGSDLQASHYLKFWREVAQVVRG